MKLFIIDSDDVQTSIFQIATQLYGLNNSTIIWVDGVKDGSDFNWYTYTTGKHPVWTGLAWYTSAAQATGCLAITNLNAPFHVDGFPCPRSMIYACQYIK